MVDYQEYFDKYVACSFEQAVEKLMEIAALERAKGSIGSKMKNEMKAMIIGLHLEKRYDGLPEAIKESPIITRAFVNFGMSLEKLLPKFRGDRDIVKLAISCGRSSDYRFALGEAATSDFAMQMVKSDYLVLRYVPDELKTKEMVLEASHQWPNAYQYAGPFASDPEVKATAPGCSDGIDYYAMYNQLAGRYSD